MPDIGYQQQLLQRMQDPNSESSPIGAMRALGNSIGNAWQGQQSRTDEQDLMKAFMTEDATPETIQRFAELHPQMPVQDIYVKASIIGRQKKAQKIKDMVKTLQGAIAGGAALDEKLIPSLYPNATPDEIKEFNTVLAGAQQAGLNFKNLNAKDQIKLGPNEAVYEKNIAGNLVEKAKNTVIKPTDLDTMVMKPDGKGVIRTTKENAAALMEKEGYIPYEAPSKGDPHVDELMKTTNPKTGKLYTKLEAIDMSRKQPTPKNQQSFIDPKGNTVLVDTSSPDAQSVIDSKKLKPVSVTTANLKIEGINDRSDRIFKAQLRKEFNALPEIKEANSVEPKIASMESAYAESQKTKNFVAVDQALITLFNKLTDPNSVVRESEYARTAMNIPLINMIKGKAQKVMEGGAGLTSSERSALINMARLMKKGYDDIKGKRVEEYRSYAIDAGLDPQETLRNPYSSGPKVGDIKQGYRFKGGNPANKASWEKVQ